MATVKEPAAAALVAALEATITTLDGDVKRIARESAVPAPRMCKAAVPEGAKPILARWDAAVRSAADTAAALQPRVQGRPTLLSLLDACVGLQKRLDEYQGVLARAGIPSVVSAHEPAPEPTPVPSGPAVAPAASTAADPHTPQRPGAAGDEHRASPGHTPLSDMNRTPSLSAFGISSTTLEVLQNKGKDQTVQRVVEALTESEEVLDAQLDSLSQQLQLTSRTATVDRRLGVHSTVPAGLVGQRLVLS